MSGPTKATRALVWERDAGRCARCGLPITREWSLHHRVPRGAGGSRRPELNSPANLVLLCGSATSPKGAIWLWSLTGATPNAPATSSASWSTSTRPRCRCCTTAPGGCASTTTAEPPSMPIPPQEGTTDE